MSQKKNDLLTSVNVSQDQSNENEMEDEAKDLFVPMRMTEEEEAIKAFSMFTIFTNNFLYHANYIFLGIDILQERMKKLCEENVIAKELLRAAG